jgi:hypothetical protein
MPLPHGERRADAFREEGFVHRHAFRRQDTDVDFGLGIEDAGAQQALAMIFDLHHVAVSGGRGESENFAVVNPRMAGHYAVSFTRFKYDSYERFHGL